MSIRYLNNKPSFDWDIDGNTERLKKRWVDGYSASQIANELGNVSRSAVLGKLHRLGLTGNRKTPKAGSNEHRRTIAGKSRPRPRSKLFTALPTMGAPKMTTPPSELGEPPEPLNLSIMDLTPTTCRWPVDDIKSGDTRFCGHFSRVGKSYCCHHEARAWKPLRVRSKTKGGGHQAAGGKTPWGF